MKSTAKKKWEMHVISHTHWDREWYATFQQFRIRLVDLIDHLLEIMDRDPKYLYYTLDGQTVVLEDYLEIRPRNENKLRQYIKEGKIFVGPWHILPDEFLVSAEATVRNLLLGHKIAQRFGAVMKVGYIPDPFGHISQLPQILRGFGIDSVVLWRGFGGEPGQEKSEYWWESPDGSRILMIHLPRVGYCNALYLPREIEKVLARIEWIKSDAGSRATTPYLLLLNGVDHVEPQPELPGILRELNQKLNDATIIHSHLPAYIEKVKSFQPELATIRGELRQGWRHAFLLADVISTRMYLKQRNERIQTLLEKWAEPWATWAGTLGETYPQNLIWQSWKYLLQNHPHDSICGCSIDEVHRQMLTRFNWSQEIASEVVEKSLTSIAQKINTSRHDKTIQHLAIFNPLSWSRSELITATVDFLHPEQPGMMGFFEKEPPSLPYKIPVKGLIIKDKKGKEIPYQIIDVREDVKTIMRPHLFPQMLKVIRYQLTFPAEEVPAVGYSTFQVIPSPEIKKYPSWLRAGESFLENEYLKVNINSQGGLDIYDRQTGVTYYNCNCFEDSGDVGDEYNYSYPLRDTIIFSLGSPFTTALVESGPLRATLKIVIDMKIPENASLDRKERSSQLVNYIITSWVSLAFNSRRIDITTEVNNNAGDHRLRVLFPSGIDTNYSWAEGQYHVLQRPVKRPPLEEGYLEEPASTHPQQSFIDVNDSKRGLTIINQGLPEYEVKDDTSRTIAITLLRCVGFLSRGDLLTRKNYAGSPIPTPEAQCKGKHIFKYAILPHSGTWQEAKVYQSAHGFNVPLQAVQTDSHPGTLSTRNSFLTITPGNLVLSAIKQAEDGTGIIIRFYNTTEEPVSGTLEFFRPLKKGWKTNLNEEESEELKIIEDRKVTLPVKSFEVITMKISF